MIFAIWSVGGPETEAIRRTVRAEHLRFVIERRHMLLFGGACMDEARTAMTGMLMVIEADSREAAEAFVAAEPYSAAGSFTSISIEPFGLRIPEPHPGFIEEELDRELSSR